MSSIVSCEFVCMRLTLSLQCWQFLKLVLHEASCRARSREMMTMLQCWHRFGRQSHLDNGRMNGNSHAG